MFSLSQLNKIIDKPKAVAIVDDGVVIIDEISNEDDQVTADETLFPFLNRQAVIDEATRLSKFFKEAKLPDIYISGIKNLKVFVDECFKNMRAYYTDDIYLRDRVMDLKTIYERVNHPSKNN